MKLIPSISKRQVMKTIKKLLIFEVGGLDVIKEGRFWYVFDPNSNTKMTEPLSCLTECYVFVLDTYGSFQIVEEFK